MARRRRKKKPATLVDIIIPVYNRFDLLEMCLDALPEAFGDILYSIIIVDNHSETENAKSFYKKFTYDNKIIVIRNQENLGFPRACNKGFKKGSSPLVFFLNSDVIMNPMSGDFLVRAMDEPSVGVAGMKLLFPEPQEIMNAGLDMNIRPAQKVQHVGLATNIRGQIIHHHLGWKSDNPRVNVVRDVYMVTGAALMTRRRLYQETGGFDEIYGMGTFEDCDYCLKVRELGHRIIVETKAEATHYVGATAEKYKISYPLNENYQIFANRWKDKLLHTDWQVL